MLQKPEINSIIEGKVVKIKPFGAIVQLPDENQGLVHISHISSRYVQDINDFVNVGDAVNVKVLSIDEANGKISLSIKDAEQHRDNQNPHYNSHHDGNGRDTRDTKDGRDTRDRSFSKANEQQSSLQPSSFEEKFKEWVKISNERHAGINKRNKRK